MYGPTEATITATELYCPPDVGFISIGRPVHNMHCYVVDAQLRPVPVGVPGELLLSGPRLAVGYAGRPDLTAQTFVANPCLELVRKSTPDAQLHYYQKAYRSGDLVRWRADGTIEFLGRIDRQVKINGVRIELGEVESALSSAPGVEQAVVTAVMDDHGAKRLVGYVVPATAAPAEIIAHCSSMLVPAMVPSVVVALEAFPMLAGGKVDVKALPAPDWSAAGTKEYVAPATETEATVQRVWQEVLRRTEDKPLSVLADFFAAGGTSLQVGWRGVCRVWRHYSRLGPELPPSCHLAAPRCAGVQDYGAAGKGARPGGHPRHAGACGAYHARRRGCPGRSQGRGAARRRHLGAPLERRRAPAVC